MWGPGDPKRDARWVCGQIHNGELAEENEANARLIASAPDLLEALRSILQYVDHAPFCSVQDHPDFTCSCGLHAIRQDALAAIAKATGEQP